MQTGGRIINPQRFTYCGGQVNHSQTRSAGIVFRQPQNGAFHFISYYENNKNK